MKSEDEIRDRLEETKLTKSHAEHGEADQERLAEIEGMLRILEWVLAE